MSNVEIIIDWKALSSIDEIYASIFSQVQAPPWHGTNLDALNDSLVTGGINKFDPPYNFTNRNIGQTNKKLVKFQNVVIEIFIDSVRNNPGSKLAIN